MYKEIPEGLDGELSVVIVPLGEYLELGFILSRDYPFLSLSLTDRMDVENEEPQEALIQFTSQNLPDMFERDNNYWVFKIDTKEFDFYVADFHAVLTGVDENGYREELRRFVITFKHNWY